MTLSLWCIAATITTIATLGVFLMLKYLEGEFTKKITSKEPELPPDCELIDLGGNFMFKTRSGYVCMHSREPYLWTIPTSVAKYCISDNREQALKQGIIAYNFFKTIGRL